MKKTNISPNQEAIDLCKKMKVLERRAFAIHGQMAGLKKQIEKVCIHNDIERRYEYKDGYISKDVCKVCKVCGKIISRKLCDHMELERQHDYEPGGYLDRCVYINKDVCKICGEVIHEERILGGFC